MMAKVLWHKFKSICTHMVEMQKNCVPTQHGYADPENLDPDDPDLVAWLKDRPDRAARLEGLI